MRLYGHTVVRAVVIVVSVVLVVMVVTALLHKRNEKPSRRAVIGKQ